MKDINKICIVSGSHRSGTTWIGNTIAKGTNSAYIWEPFNIAVPLSQRSSYGKSFLKIKNWFHVVENSDDQICIDLEHVINEKNILYIACPTKGIRSLCEMITSNNVNSNEIDFIVEDNKLKHGKFIPVTSIPVSYTHLTLPTSDLV